MSAKSSGFNTWVPLATALVLFLALIGTAARSRSQLHRFRAQQDSSATELQRQAVLTQELLVAGDSLPSAKLLTSHGDTVLLRELPAQAKYLYFGRGSCPPCQILESGWAAANSARLDSVVFITFHPDSNLAPDTSHNSLSWIHQSPDSVRYVNFVPTVVVRAPSNRVESVVHGSLLKVTAALDMWGVISADPVLQELENARRRRGLVVTPSPP